MRLRLHPEASAEALKAKLYIREDDPLQADLFAEALQHTFARTRSSPELFPKFSADFRKARVEKFRYAVIYRNQDDGLLVIAVMHLHRKPGYWKNRKTE